MRPEQVAQLTQIEERLTDLFIYEAQDGSWPRGDSQQGRGDRYWCKKNALATLTLVGRIQTVLRDIRTDGGQGKGLPGDRPPEELGADSIEQEAKRLEAQGVAILKRRAKGR